MQVFWTHIIGPLLDAAQARSVIEIGVDRGETTELLLSRAEGIDGAIVHAIDPSPADDFDRGAFERSHPHTLRFHAARSHDALPDIGAVDAVLIDGDHNWFTVRGELRLLSAAAAEHGVPLPLIIVHDVGWPYGRRDMYYDPSSIPPEGLHEAAQAGPIQGEEELSPDGINPWLWTALHEGGLRNGVLTAVEDFVAQYDAPCDLLVVDGFHGIGVLASKERLDASPDLIAALVRLRSAEFARAWARELERNRIDYALMAWRAMGKPGPGGLEETDVEQFEAPPIGDDGIARALAEGEPAMIVERPDLFGSRRAGRPLEVTGWAWSGAGIEAVWVTIDGRARAKALHGLVRPDLWSLYGGELGMAGFAFRADPREWETGWHEISVVAVTRDGRKVGVSASIESVEATEELPQKNSPPGTVDPLPTDRLAIDPWRPIGDTLESMAEALARDEMPFVSPVHRDRSIAPEHRARYRWAAGLVEKAHNVLDVGCATGWSTALLAERAQHATGVDPSPMLVAEAERAHNGVATFRRAELIDLPFDDGEFHLVVCFEAIERVTDAERALDELRRVLCPGGLLLISCANRDAYPPGNPLHRHLYAPSELEDALRARFANVAIHRQQTYLASLLCADEALRTGDCERPIGADTTKGAAHTPGEELYTVAAATDGSLPSPPSHLALGTAVDPDRERLIRHWQQRAIHAETQAAAIRTDAHHAANAQREVAERAAGREAELAGRVAALERKLSVVGAELTGARAAAVHLEALQGSLSWRLTRPLRSAKRAALRAKPG